ncbi:PREDICTED: uncharacterized protein LOC106804774 [Priapulus caudatus]|uniref:Uncharacterized protein LOC106804774 n=1 Tax=Priapulus caudatus TaxID=37621 RepID=A0ABM1DNR4_PRICU|nr:PREDICTED: uncharacterized protein LOC106804774 [Priapulus caudatus]XP_014661586.1 PREDICTED: uncharacterized protein LOC106804774 [Priapulus caudatus]
MWLKIAKGIVAIFVIMKVIENPVEAYALFVSVVSNIINYSSTILSIFSNVAYTIHMILDVLMYVATDMFRIIVIVFAYAVDLLVQGCIQVLSFVGAMYEVFIVLCEHTEERIRSFNMASLSRNWYSENKIKEALVSINNLYYVVASLFIAIVIHCFFPYVPLFVFNLILRVCSCFWCLIYSVIFIKIPDLIKTIVSRSSRHCRSHSSVQSGDSAEEVNRQNLQRIVRIGSEDSGPVERHPSVEEASRQNLQWIIRSGSVDLDADDSVHTDNDSAFNSCPQSCNRVTHSGAECQVLPAASASVITDSPAMDGDTESSQEDPDRFLCVICQDGEKTVLFLPCRHLCVCEECGTKALAQKCPMCREYVHRIIHVYL